MIFPRLPVVARPSKRLELDPSITPEQIEEYLALKRRVEEKRQREERERQEARRVALRDAYAGPLDLIIAMNPGWKRTPALEVVSAAFEETVATPGARVIVTMSPQEGKALDCGMDILTTAGWSTMGDLVAGDEVFHPDGHPVRVVEAFAPRTDRPCYRVTTTDGRAVVVDAEHLWTVQDLRRSTAPGAAGTVRKKIRHWETVTTAELLRRGVLRGTWKRAGGREGRSYAYRLPVQHAIVSKPVDLPIDPYLFGAWLGDGTSAAVALTVGSEDLDFMTEQVRAAGAYISSTAPTNSAWRIGFGLVGAMPGDGANPRLHRLGVWRNKHIPDLYLTAGTEQRLALLQGLLDTDGSISTNGNTYRVEFTSTRRDLADGVLYLVRSLGWRATMRESAARLNGREVGSRWRVCFTPQRGEMVPFRLPRKADRIQEAKSRAGERHAVSIASIEPVESRPVRCIRVERADGLFLAGRDLVATHNSESVKAASLRALQHNPDCRIAYASYAEWLARRNAGQVRDLILAHGSDAKDSVTGDPLPDLLGFALNPDRAAEGRWQLGHGHRGSAVAVGLTSGLTGAAVDLLIVDDPVKDQQAADSEVIRTRLHEWWAAVAETRLAPHTSIIVIQTRWHESDLAGKLIEEDEVLPAERRQWKIINIPALAQPGVPDALADRPEGRDEHGWMISARGDRVPMWSSIQAKRPRVFSAMYQGNPTPLEGGIFLRSWFDDHRVDERPAVVLDRVIGVDPADTGTGDAAGILIAELGSDGHIYWIADLSGQLSQAEWARRTCLAWMRYECLRVLQERTLGMQGSIPQAWALIHRQAVAISAFGGVEGAVEHLLARGDRAAADITGLREIENDVEQIIEVGENGPRVQTVNPKHSKQQRAESATQPFQDGRAHIVGHLPALEHECCTWQIGQKSPNRLDTLAMLTSHFGRSNARSRVLV